MPSRSNRHSVSLAWFRDDLRLSDNPAFAAAVADDRPVAALYVLEEGTDVPRQVGAAARWKLHGALKALGAALDRLSIPLLLVRGDATTCVPEIAERLGAAAIYWNRRYAPAAVAADRRIKADLKAAGRETASFNGALLVEPWQVETSAGGPYRTFTPFCKAARAHVHIPSPTPAPESARPWPAPPELGDALDDWGLTPTRPDWAGGLRETWGHGEAGARERLDAFLADGFAGYRTGRDRPASAHVSSLSAHLRFGEISPRQVRQAAALAAGQAGGARDADFEAFERELYWRDFCHNLLFHFDDIAEVNIQSSFDDFPWRSAPADLKAWRRGRTGYPIVDAGMRQLWHTGWMHNRVRMVVASFLTKHLLVDWREGERWFWDTLVDADAASNPANWQWTAGCGADAAPYFRIFNPVTQGERFDADGAYVRRWVPEIAGLPDRYVHAPWTAPEAVRAKANVRLGADYPEPIVDHRKARARALAAFETIKAR